jgi:hypothetical protein
VAESNDEKGETLAPPAASAPDERIKDLNEKVSEDDENSVVGGKTTGKGSPEPYFT